MEVYVGCVENRLDPLKLGRCQVRVVGLHTEDKNTLPTLDLPWAYPMGPINSAAMSGIGHSPVGPVEGTWVIVSFMDQDQQQPIILGTIGGIPQSKAGQIAAQDSDGNILGTDGGFLINSDGAPVQTATGANVAVGTVEAQNTPPANAPSSEPTSVPIVNNFEVAIPTTPPPGDTKFSSSASASIQAIIAACDKVGLTSKYAKCAVLGICAEESAFKLQAEGCYYSEVSRLSSFAVFRGNTALAEQYVKWPISNRAEFFEVVYGYNTSKGRELGNTLPGDGGKYYGKGFIQLTGKSNYSKHQQLLADLGINIDLVTNPDELLSDIDTGALVAAIFVKTKTRCDQTDPGFFSAARAAVGGAKSGWANKQKYYEYFLGSNASPEPTDKTSVSENRTYTAAEIAAASVEKRSALSEDRSDVEVLGFKDPYGKYPLRHHMHEPDTNRLARGNIEDTSVGFKDATRKTTIPMANSTDTWRQPYAPYSAKYPYNHVYESESGHIQEFDDSPGGERINLYHRKGTFVEIDANGTQVNRIVGDSYHIVDNNGAIFIGGSAFVTVEGSVNILVQGTADIQVDGLANINLHNDANIGVGKDLKVAVGGNIDIKAGGHINVEAGMDIGVKSSANINVQSSGSTGIGAGSSVGIRATDIITSSTTITANASGAVGIKGNKIDYIAASTLNMDYTQASWGNGDASVSTVDPSIMNYIAGDFVVGNQYKITSVGTTDFTLIGASANTVGTTFTATGAGEGTGTANSLNASSLTLVAPVFDTGSGQDDKFLPDIVRDFGEIERYPNPDELDDPAKRYEKDAENATIPPEILSDATNIPGVVDSVSSISSSGTTTQPNSEILNNIKTVSGFSAGYTISKHFKLGHLCLSTGGLPAALNKVKGNRFYGNAGQLVQLTDRQIVENLAYAAENILERIYELEGPPVVLNKAGTWNITSGYRPGFERSEHGYGHAIDIQPVDSSQPMVVYEWAKRLSSQLVYNQFLFEYLDNRSPRNHRKPNLTRWLHISYRPQGNAMEVATMLNDGDQAIGGWYKPGLICLDDKPKT